MGILTRQQAIRLLPFVFLWDAATTIRNTTRHGDIKRGTGHRGKGVATLSETHPIRLHSPASGKPACYHK